MRELAKHQASMAIFLSAGMMRQLSEELMAGGYPADTPAALVYKATWPDEKKILCTVGTMARRADEAGLTKTTMILIGGAVAHADYDRSFLYHRSLRRSTGKGRKNEGGGDCIYRAGEPSGGEASGSASRRGLGGLGLDSRKIYG